MDKYYYLVSELPFLQFGESANMEKDDFLKEAKKWLNEKDFSRLQEAEFKNLGQGQSKEKSLNDYREFEMGLRDELARARGALKEGRDYKLPGALSKIINEGNPLEIEKKLLHYRWQFIEEKEEDHYFDLGFIIAYFLKLQILGRLFAFNKEKGMIAFDKLCETRGEL